MDHVGTMGTFVAAGLRGRGLGRRLAEANFANATRSRIHSSS